MSYSKTLFLKKIKESKLSLYNHIKQLCEKYSQKVSALSKLSSYLDIKKETHFPRL